MGEAPLLPHAHTSRVTMKDVAWVLCKFGDLSSDPTNSCKLLVQFFPTVVLLSPRTTWRVILNWCHEWGGGQGTDFLVKFPRIIARPPIC